MTASRDCAIIGWGMNDVIFDRGDSTWGCYPFDPQSATANAIKTSMFALATALRHFPRSVVMCGHDTWDLAYGSEMSKWTAWARQVLNSVGILALPLDVPFQLFDFSVDNIHFVRTH